MKKIIPFALFAAACQSEEGVKVYNSTPEVAIISHSSGEVFLSGYETSFQASISDGNHEASALRVTWTSDQRTLCPESIPELDGTSICLASLNEGESIVRVQVTDPEEASGLDSIDIEVTPTFAPTVEIQSPTNTGLYYSDQLILFSAVILDNEDPSIDLNYTWESSLDGILSTAAAPNSDGAMEEYLNLSEGEHALTLSVTDQSNKTTTQSISISVGGPNSSPDCSITSPQNDSTFVQGENIIFTATAIDQELSGDDLTISWLSDKDGVLGSGIINSDGNVTLSYAGLSSNTHTIQFTVEDEIGSRCSDSIIISVGTPPILTLLEPTNGEIFSAGDIVSFTGTLEDNEEIPSSITLSWVSDIDGEFSTQGANSNGNLALNTSSLSIGLHSISITATDEIGLTDSAILSLHINSLPTAPTVSISPDPANTSDTLIAYATGSTDEDGDNVSYSYAWYQNGVLTTNATASLPSSATQKGELWSVRVTPNDGYQDGSYGEAFITIDNAQPVVNTISITPSAPNTTDTLTCNVSVIEADGESLIETYTWVNNTTGLSLGSSSTLVLTADIVSPGDAIECQYSVEDSESSDAATSSVYVSNTGPTESSVVIAPSVASIGTEVSCNLAVDDPDQLGYSEVFTWTNDTTGATLGVAQTLLIESSFASPEDEIACSASAIDPSGASGSGSTSIILENQDPIIDGISFSPTTPALGDSVLCVVAVTEPDDETPTYIYEWVNEETGDVLGSDEELYLDASATTGGERISCSVTVEDGYGGTVTDSNSFVVANSAPEIDSFSVSSSTATTSDTVTCSGAASDSDGDTLSESYIWTNEATETLLGSNASLSLSPLSVSPGDTISCTYSVDDGTASASDLAAITIINSTPILSSLSIVPSAPYLGDTLNCIPSVDEPDLESYTESYEWSNVDTGTLIGTASTLTLSNTIGNPQEEIQCSVIVTDVSGATTIDQTSVIIENLDPTIDAISLSASSIAIGESIECSADASDPEGEIPTLSYEWTNVTNATTIGSGASLTLTASLATGLDEIACTATATDSYGGSDTESASILVDPTVPEFTTEASISPSSGVTTSSSLSCAGVAIDPDGGSVSLSYEWVNTTNATTLGTSPSLSLTNGTSQPTDIITCTITATDTASEQNTSSASVMVGNSAPSLSNISITPASAIDTSSTLVCAASVSDPDGETLTVGYEWTLGSTSLGSTDTLTLSPSLAQPGDTITCTVSVADGYGASGSLSTSVSISNTPPVIDSIAISPDPAYNDDTLSCDVTASDADGQSLTTTYSWTNTDTGSVLGSGATVTLDSATAARNQTVQCVATVTDTTGQSDSSTTSITLGNRAPGTATVELSPDPAYLDSTITCTASDSIDDDDDTVSYLYVWSINGTDQTETTSTLSGSFVAGDTITCTVTPSDGLLSGTATAASTTINNRLPTVDSVSLSPDPLYTDDTITATASASDDDGDSTTLSYQWSVNGTVIQSGTDNSFDSSLFGKEDEVTVSVTADDGNDTSVALEDSLTCSNTPPTAPSLSITSNPVELIDDVVCSISTDATDLDGDSISYTFSWTVDGSAYSGATDTSTSSTISASEIEAGEDWICTVTPNDGDDDGSTGSTSVTIDSDWDGAVTFTNCGQSGRTGPSQSQCNSAYSGGTLDGLVTLSSGIQQWTVPNDGTYEIEVQGAAGGTHNQSGRAGGKGARMIGEFTLSEGDVINVLVGQMGGNSTNTSDTDNAAPGGGGGTYVWIEGESTPLIVAGGGGGGTRHTQFSNLDAVTSEDAQDGASSSNGGTSGNGGRANTGGSSYWAGGGAGWYTNGTAGNLSTNCQYYYSSPCSTSGCTSSSSAEGGRTPLNGGFGGIRWYDGLDEGGDGGFGGGGGGGSDNMGTGGGGGYSGGGGANYYSVITSGNPPGGGGGSYNAGSSQSNTGGYNTSHGVAIIDKI
ncbi:MAG: hypothetical protein VX278_00365 [Myxococcota bacterium]|nr:hypothetical protein [Myxococcota bacterium]